MNGYQPSKPFNSLDELPKESSNKKKQKVVRSYSYCKTEFEQLLNEGYTVKFAIPMDNYIEYIVEK